MTTPQKTIHDAITGEITVADYTADELAQYELDIVQDKKDRAAKAKAEQALADKRQIILDRLGITADEFNALLR